MKTYRLFVVSFVLAVVPALALAGGAKKANQQPATKETKVPANAKALQDLETAHSLIAFGRREKHPESLLVAAQILARTPTRKLESASVASPTKSTVAPPTQDNSPKALVAEAAKLSSAPYLVALVDATNKVLQEEIRGATTGPQIDAFVIQPGQTINWNPINFRAGERAEVFISNGVMGKLALEIFDENDNLVVQDAVPGNYFRCVWVPNSTGNFRMRLTNNDEMPFRCGLATN